MLFSFDEMIVGAVDHHAMVNDNNIAGTIDRIEEKWADEYVREYQGKATEISDIFIMRPVHVCKINCLTLETAPPYPVLNRIIK